MNNTILMIAAGMEIPKKDYREDSYDNLYLNYSILGLGTMLYNKGYTGVKMFQGDYKSITEIIFEIQSAGVDVNTLVYPILISTPSFYSLSWVKMIVRELKTINPLLKFVLGGRWVVDNNKDWLTATLPEIDFFVEGCADNFIEEILTEASWSNLSVKQNTSHTLFSELNYRILNNFNIYQPCIELSRGCGMGCSFCLESEIKSSEIKEPFLVINEAKAICELYEIDELNFYFQSSLFVPSFEWVKTFNRIYIAENMKFKWRFQTRVDVLNTDTFQLMADSGLKVVDLGLESASINQLLAMNKTNNPEKYLLKSENTIRHLSKLDIFPKLNIMLYPGENEISISENMAWLERNKNYIRGISAGPFILFLNGIGTAAYARELEKITKRAIDLTKLYENGYMNIDLSEEINILKSFDYSNEIAKKYMSDNDRHFLKTFSYLRRV